MAVGREGSSSKSSLLNMEKRVTRIWPRLVARLRAKLNCERECLEKQKAKGKHKEMEWGKWNEFLLKEDACIRHGVHLTLGILDAEDEGDSVRADHLRHSRSELVAKHMGETQDFFTGGLN